MSGERWFVCHEDKVLDRELWVKALTASKARWKVICAADDAGFKLDFADVRVLVDRSGLPPVESDVLKR